MGADELKGDAQGMGRQSGFFAAVVRANRDAARREVARQRAESQAVRAFERAQNAYARAQKTEERERGRLYTESRIAEVALKNHQLEEQVDELKRVLSHTLEIDDYFDLDTLRQELVLPIFDPQ